ncbi:hypothetical protein OIU85_024381 [Salix viminalis]|uniref:Uncharacterized protein n=1 Tax=Salix viminalis TaxID=40686 RepID=A0A9Q0Z4S3_SALVM|nr:hypothetical protein OIU85_024381 [Salix viminalis]
MVLYGAAYKLHKKNRSLEIMDPTLASSAAAERKAVSLEEPTRPGISGSRYRSRRPAEMSSSTRTSDTARTFGESDSRTFDSSSNSNTATGSTSAQITPRSFDPRGKRPIES